MIAVRNFFQLRQKAFAKAVFALQNSFIVLSLAVMASGIFSALFENEKVAPVLKKYIEYLAIYEGWNMFSPRPHRFDFFISAVIHYADGQSFATSFSRPGFSTSNLDLHDLAQSNLLQQNVFKDRKFFAEGMARYVLLNTKAPGVAAKPVSVDLLSNISLVQWPTKRWVAYPRRHLIYEEKPFYHYEVENADLQAD